MEARRESGLTTQTLIFSKAVEWIKHLRFTNNNHLRIRLTSLTCECFKITEAQLILAMEGRLPVGQNGSSAHVEVPAPVEVEPADEEAELNKILLAGGWLEHYRNYTMYNEAPLSFHLVSSMVVLGAAVKRKCYVDMGFFKVNGNCSALLIGPTGKVKKTFAIDVATELVRKNCLCPMISGKATSEAIISELVQSASQFIYAPEFSVFMGKQRYMDGLTPMLLRLLDDPPEIEALTISRGKQTIMEPTVCMLGGSTMSLLTSSSADEVLSGGFLNRMMVINEENTDRCFPFPRQGPGIEELNSTLNRIKNYEGPIGLSSQANLVYQQAYRRRKAYLSQSTDSVAEISQRGTTHWLRIAMLVHLAECGFGDICADCMQFAIDFISFLERKLVAVARSIDRTTNSQELDFVLSMLEKLGGAADHSTLLRRVASRVNAQKLKNVIQTLEESGQLKITRRGSAQYYILTKEEVTGASS